MDRKDKVIENLALKVANLELANSQLTVEIQLLQEQIQTPNPKEGD